MSLIKPFYVVILFIFANLTVIPISIFYLRESLINSVIAQEQKILINSLNKIEEKLLVEKKITDVERLSELLSVFGLTSNTRISIIDTSGKVLFDTHVDHRTMDNHADRPEVFEAIKGRLGVSQRYSKTLKDFMLYAAKEVYLRDGYRMILRIGKSFFSKEELFERNIGYAVGAGGIIALINIWLLILLEFLGRARVSELMNSIVANIRDQTPLRPEILEDKALKKAVKDISDLSDFVCTLEQRVDTLNLMLSGFYKSEVASIIITNTNFYILSYNEGSKRFLKERYKRLIGINFLDVFRSSEILELCKMASSSDGRVNDVVELKTGDQIFTAEISITKIQKNCSETVGYLIEMHDLSQLVALKEVEEEFLAGAGHELRTPLSSIKGYVETLKEEGIENREQSLRFLGVIEDQVKRLERVINAMITLAQLKGKGGLLKDELTEVEIYSLAEEAKISLNELSLERGIEVKIEGEKGIYHPMRPDLMHHVLRNLLENALKFGPSGSQVVMGFRKEDGLYLWVEDKGPGIKDFEKEKIFNRFYKGSTFSLQKGAGLGLALARAAVEVHRGKIWVESPGIGSKFVVWLPDLWESSIP